MIIMKYCGGLGNQMYQYAMSVVLLNLYPNQVIKSDIFHYNLLNEHNGFELESYFELDISYATKKEIREIHNGYIPGKIVNKFPVSVRRFILDKFQWYYRTLMDIIRPAKKKNYLEERDFQKYKNVLGEGNWYVSGMWQDIKYIKGYKAQIVQAFQMKHSISSKNLEIMKNLESGKAVAVHVRGGDFLKLGLRYNLCSEKYYAMALSHIDDQLPIYVFTDDIEYASKFLENRKIAGYVSHGVKESINDMYMLSRAKYLVISNSTFAFWGAFLNEGYQCIVCPQYMRKDKEMYVSSVYDEDWIYIDNREDSYGLS